MAFDPKTNTYTEVKTSNGQTTTKTRGYRDSHYREVVTQNVTTPVYSTTVNTRGGERKITNLDMRSTWGQAIPLLWGHTRVKGLPIWANNPLEASGAAGADIPAPSRPFVDFNPNDPPPPLNYSGAAGLLNAYAPPPTATPQNSSSTTTFSYFADFAYGIGYRGRESAQHFLRKMWIDGALVYDAATNFRERRWNWTFYDGSQDGPDPVMRGDPQIATEFKDIRYPGLMYVLIRNVDLSKTGLRPPDVTCEIWASNGAPVSEVLFDVGPAVLSGRIGVNWFNRVVYSGSASSGQGNKIFAFDIDDLIFLQETALQMPSDDVISTSLNFFYIPWLNTLVQRGQGVAPRVYFHEADSGLLLAQIAEKAIAVKSGANVVPNHRYAAAVFNPLSGITYMAFVGSVNGREVNFFEHTREGGWFRTGWISDLISNTDATGKIVSICGDDKNAAFYLQVENGNIFRYSPVLGTVELVYLNELDREGFLLNYDANLNILVAFFRKGSVYTFVGIEGGSARDDDENFVLYERTALGVPAKLPNTPHQSLQSNLSAGTLGYGTVGVSSAVIEIATGQQRSYGSAFRGSVWDSERFLFIGTTGGGQLVNRVISPYNPDDRITLGSFLQDIGERLGYARANVVVTDIEDTIIGAMIVDDTNARGLLQDTCNFFRINMVESGNTLRFTRRETGDDLNVIAEIPLKKMSRIDENDDAPVMLSNRLDENTIPGALTVWYIDRDADFSPIPYTASRNSTNTAREASLNLPYVMEKSQVATLASGMLYDAWAVQLSHSFRLPPRYGYVEPGDVIDVIDGLYTDSVRLIQATVNGDWSISVTALSVRESETPIIDVDATRYRGLADGFFDGNPACVPIVVDGPLVNFELNDDNAAINQVIAVSARNQPNWPGGLITYESVSVARGLISNFRGNPPWGRVIGTLGDASPCATDYENVLRVQMPEFPFDPVSETASLSFETLCAVGKPGAWEYMTFGEFEWSNGIATFSKLIRGRFGTDTMTDKHSQGDVFVMLGSFFASHFVPLGDIGSTAIYAAIGLGEELLAGNRQQTPISGNSQRHYEPGDIRASLDGGDIEITWKRRDRLELILEGWENDGPEVVGLSDPVEAYRVSILNTATGALVRGVDVTGQTSYTYTAAQQTADGYTAGGAIRLRVWQTSSFVGAGFAKERFVNVAI
jgi:hypothetical protein